MTKELFLPSKPRYDILDGLRGVAALVILLYHVLEGCGVILGHGYLGVDFFYVLSGFVIGYAYDDRWGRMNVGGFFKRRIIRLHPMVIMDSHRPRPLLLPDQQRAAAHRTAAVVGGCFCFSSTAA